MPDQPLRTIRPDKAIGWPAELRGEALKLYCLGSEGGEIAVTTDADVTTDELSRRLRDLGHLDPDRPLWAWMILDLTAAVTLERDQTLAQAGVRYGDCLYWRVDDRPRSVVSPSPLKTPREAGKFSGTPASRVLRPTTRKGRHAAPMHRPSSRSSSATTTRRFAICKASPLLPVHPAGAPHAPARSRPRGRRDPGDRVGALSLPVHLRTPVPRSRTAIRGQAAVLTSERNSEVRRPLISPNPTSQESSHAENGPDVLAPAEE